MAGLKYWVWLSEVKGLTNRSKLLLLDHFGSPENIYYADEDEYRLVEGIEPRQIALLAEKPMEDADRILGACSRLGLRLLTMQDADYPVRLRNIFEPPCLLYVKGQLPVIDEEVAVAMVGTRKASPYGVEAAEKIAYGLSRQGAVVISGAAAGVDSASHRGALRAGGKTIAVLGNGLDVVYPAENAWLYRDIAASGALISEYPPGTAAEAWHFPVRNRIISGLSLATIVVEAPEKSGALITANTALEQGRDVFAVPGPIDAPLSRGCNRLIADGAAFLPADPGSLRKSPHNGTESDGFLLLLHPRLLPSEARLRTQVLCPVLLFSPVLRVSPRYHFPCVLTKVLRFLPVCPLSLRTDVPESPLCC